ncbi:selenium-dependent molybdenum cofactor biosynthesis protein YqeB [Porcincola intestinalis]|uniref:selenium-dependent molybdenum cofactor biosynthesis protein YqeB n=1 Tax=Porcincola intestinalis TaxID=2606632 RepID=UPI0023F444DF|nr:selenium-dependent molybdenum cofactor biosynthesis protein YqeB [Porcincola intestinalis]MCI6767458.1 EF2563 family selenium-dependent molybdenum hydroxylase system protein [Lachnospiraceae bacterium]MDD7059589.1 selenium-dependent molybdenum cofactor biosynthesis protein YqeB [Porcincola intestinalis]MDY5283837.1 selenium-dependent molybdenum cofactor biosynthesis protein YqeB [Porcincola intestinalis]MDY5579306.1 selenium-dependent molybdenum cofactor biosynthesis protein YqeB [Porcincola
MVTDQLVIVRGGGDIATGTIRTLRRAGFPVLILESAHPSAIRRTVALSEAVYEGSATVEDVSVTLAHNLDEAEYLLFQDGIAMLVDPDGAAIRDIIHSGEKYAEWDTGLTTLEGGGRHLFLTCVVDAILAKKNLGTTKDMAPLVIALGPGFTAGKDCDVVIETMRGHSLGRAITEGEALHNTGTPGLIAGHAQDRVIHSPAAGIVKTCAAIGDIVEEGQPIASIIPEESSPRLGEPGVPVRATFTGLLRGLIRDGYPVPEGFKIADIDPRASEHDNCFRISDKARAIGGSVLTELIHFAAQQNFDE